MPTTIPGSFAGLKANLEISGLQTSVVSKRQEAVRDVVSRDLTVLDSFLTGSYARQTMIAPLKEADIDILVLLDSKYFHQYNGQNGGQAALLDLVKRTLRKTYTRTPDISRNGQAVTIRFDDFAVDVVPGFTRQGGGFLIPNSLTQSWTSTDPKMHVALVSTSNQIHGGNFIPLIKMVKAWNKCNSGFFRSFHLEVLALETFTGVTISDFSSAARFFFDKGREQIRKRNLDPAGYGDDVGSYLNTKEKIEAATTKFQLAYERALKAEGNNRFGYVKSAVDLWINIFGEYFPAYG
jgi:predicted nucleotidyltransferase